MPELMGCRNDIPIGPESRLLVHFSVDVAPRGQMALMARELRCAVSVYRHKLQPNLVVNVNLAYKLASGGSNGSDATYLIMVREFGAEAEYKGLLAFELYYSVAEQVGNLIDRRNENLKPTPPDVEPDAPTRES